MLHVGDHTLARILQFVMKAVYLSVQHLYSINVLSLLKSHERPGIKLWHSWHGKLSWVSIGWGTVGWGIIGSGTERSWNTVVRHNGIGIYICRGFRILGILFIFSRVLGEVWIDGTHPANDLGSVYCKGLRFCIIFGGGIC